MPHGSAALTRRYDLDAHASEVSIGAARRILAGVSARTIAAETGMSVRTAYRWRAELVAIEPVKVGGWVATYAMRRRLPPVRISSWERA